MEKRRSTADSCHPDLERPAIVEGCNARAEARAPYTAPRLERLGTWSALTLQQTVPIFP